MRRFLVTLLVALLAASGAFVALLPTVPAAPAASASPYRSDPERVFYDADGTATVAEQLHVSLEVSATTELRGRQQLDVSWTGAHPTGGIASDLNASSAAREEYPMVLLQCRGQGEDVSPETCWTASAQERYQVSGTTWAPWRNDAFASAADRAQFVGTPSPYPSGCSKLFVGSDHWVPFRGVDKTFAGGDGGCGGMAPEAQDVSDVGIPSNTTYGVTTADGSGSARFTLWSEDENASLGCSSTVPCSLVAVPIVGLSCDAWGTRLQAGTTWAAGNSAANADRSCRGSDVYRPGEQQVSASYNLATSGLLWWASSNWRSRIVVPLRFAVSSNICGVVSKAAPLSLFGSILFNEVASQWTPKFCTTSGLDPIVHVQAADSAARNLVTAGVASVALSTFPQDGGYSRPVVQAPVSVTGFAVAFTIDGPDGSRMTTLRLNARLLAKLLSESYQANNKVKGAYEALAGNPLNITGDPEFRALNPGAPSLGVVESAATMITLNTDSDLMYALTSYLDEDIEARDFLDGVPDPWGMKVNPNYRHLSLPVSSWPLLDDFVLKHDSPCYENSPAPYLNLIASPVGQLATLVQDLQYAIPSVTVGCPADVDPTDPNTLKLRQQSRQPPGQRFVLGLVPLTAVDRYGLDAAQLQTASSVPLEKRFADASGRSFVAPDRAGLAAGAALLEADTAAGLWRLPYDALDTAGGARAYPGTMPVFATVPTSGLTADVARRAAQLLTYAAGPGQTSGISVGQLPTGALPLTAANGLGAFSSYASCAAKAVAAQRGDVPVVGEAGCRLSTPEPSETPSTPTAPPTTPVVAVPPGATAPPVTVPTVPAAAVPPTAAVTTTDAPQVLTSAASTRLGRLGLPIAAFLAVLLAVLGVGLRWGEAIGGGVVRLAAAGIGSWRRPGKRVRR